MSAPAPLPVVVVTGALGVGKTTAIARALSAKPPEERWVVILNEFTDSGIDVLTVAGSARGEFDVRLVTGGCLCCVGAEDFSRTLAGFVAGPRPARLYIEPSGLGHPAAIVEELLAYEATGAVDLLGVVALVDGARLEELDHPGIARDQVEIADVVLLAKADRAGAGELGHLQRRASAWYPAKRLVGECRDGFLPPPWGAPDPLSPDAAPVPADPVWRAAPRAAGAGVSPGGPGHSRSRHLDRDVAAFSFPRSCAFDAGRLLGSLASAPALAGVERLKGVFRVGPEDWRLVQRARGEVDSRASPWRRDSRVEVLAAAGHALDVPALEDLWASLITPAPAGP